MCLKSSQFNLTLELIESRWCSCLVHLHLTVEPNDIFLALAWDGSSSYLLIHYSLKKFSRDVREEAYSSAYWLIWRLQRPRFHDIPQISCTTWCVIQTFGFLNARVPPHKNRRRKAEREVNLKMAEEVKAGGESSWWQGDCKPNRTRTVTAILESAMNKEEGQEERLSEHQFS